MIVSRNKEYLDRCRYLSTQSKDDTVYFVHNEVGYNYRMTNVQAAIGLAQLEQLESFIRIKKENYDSYLDRGISLLPFRKDIRPNYWFYSYITLQRDRLLQYLNDNKIQTRPIWKLIHTLKPYEEAQAYQIEKALNYYDQILNLPCSTNLTPLDVEFVADTILNFKQD
jgi:dTDP-4-amino-4,6-dideoxygalactose transaminase